MTEKDATMDGQPWQVQLAPGDGLVVRVGATVLVTRPSSERQDSFVDQLRALVEDVSREQPDAPGRKLARKVAGLVSAADEDDVPPLAVLSATGAGLALLLVGDMDAEITDGSGQVERVSGRDVTTWLDKLVAPGFRSVALGSAGTEVDRRSDLQGGAVRGNGVLLAASGGTAASEQSAASSTPRGTPRAVTEPVEPPAADFVSVSLSEPLPAEELVPLPLLEPAPAPADPQALQVQGIVCSRGHFNDPTGIYCATCGISMVHQTHNLVPGPRPPLGVVVVDDGTVFTLNGDYVLGREPQNSEDVQQGRALPLSLDDPDATLSRVHAKILLQGWDVRVVDARSANGTFVAKPGQSDRTRLVPDEPTTIAPGTRITVGGRSLVFDSYRKH